MKSRECLNNIADRGFVVVSWAGSRSCRLAAASAADMAASVGQKVANNDPALQWLAANLGSADGASIAPNSPIYQRAGIGGHITLIAGLSSGNKHGVIVGRSVADFPPALIAETLAAAFEISAVSLGTDVPHPTPKVAAYLSKIVDGHDDQEIADDLDLSLRAVKERKKKTIEEFNANTLAHAVALSAKTPNT